MSCSDERFSASDERQQAELLAYPCGLHTLEVSHLSIVKNTLGAQVCVE
jgi:hypothetical protein